MPIDYLLAGISARCPSLRTGVDIGFADAAVSERLRERFKALWMTVVKESDDAFSSLPSGTVHRLGMNDTLPFDGNQFDIAVLNGEIVSQTIIREIHRILRPAGMLIFSVEEVLRRGPDCTLSKLYNTFLKNGYDIISAVRPPWWKFGSDGKILTVCARKKNWREHRPLKVIG